MRRRFQQVDVFAHEPLRGNPVAVVLDGEGLTGERMQELAGWTNLSETTFVLPPNSAEADYRVRIFTPARELPFAGHPTLGTCHAWLVAGGIPTHDDRIVQECPAGLVPIRRDGGELAFAAPPLQRSGPVEEADLAAVTAALRLDPDEVVDAAWVDNGPGWVGLLLRDAEAVLAVEPDASRIPEGGLDVGLVGPYPAGSEAAVEVRALLDDGAGVVREDPVTGSLNASLAQWLLGDGRLEAPYVSSQGTRLGRAGRPRITRDDDGSIWVGGPAHTIIEGEADLPDSDEAAGG